MVTTEKIVNDLGEIINRVEYKDQMTILNAQQRLKNLQKECDRLSQCVMSEEQVREIMKSSLDSEVKVLMEGEASKYLLLGEVSGLAWVIDSLNKNITSGNMPKLDRENYLSVVSLIQARIIDLQREIQSKSSKNNKKG